MENIFDSLENNALFRKQLIKMNPGDILEIYQSPEEKKYLLSMIQAFLDNDNFLILDKNLLYKLILMMNILRAKKVNEFLSEDTGKVIEISEKFLSSDTLLLEQLNYALSVFNKYEYPYNIEIANDSIITNLSEHYDEIRCIRSLGDPVEYYGKLSFLEVLNFTASIGALDSSYELNDYYEDVVDFYWKDCRYDDFDVSHDYKKYLKKTRKKIKRMVY